MLLKRNDTPEVPAAISMKINTVCDTNMLASRGIHLKTANQTISNVDDEFVEIPLDANMVRRRTDAIPDPPFPPIKDSSAESQHKTSSSRAYQADVLKYPPTFPKTSTDNLETVPKCDGGDFYPTDVVSEFLESHADDQVELNLPSVEDGLSSGSDLDTPRCSGRSPHLNETPVNVPFRSSAALSSVPFSSASIQLRSQSSSPVDHYISDSLVNPPLVRDIWGIMNDIKQTLADDRVVISNSKGEVSNNFRVINPESENSKKPCSLNELDNNEQTSNQLHSSDKVVKSSFIAPSGTPLSSGICERLTVQASIEEPEVRPGSHPTTGALQKNLGPSSEGSKPDVCGLEELSPSSDRRAHHWTFPQQPSVVYSSSEEEDSEKMHKSPGHSESPNSRPTLSELASRSKTAETEGSVVSSRPSSPHLTTRNTPHLRAARQMGATSSSPRKSPPNGHPGFKTKRVEEFESDEDTDQLLQKQYQSDKPVYIPELKQEARLQADRKNHVREVSVRHPDFPDSLINGVLFHARYLGSTQLLSERQPTRNSRMYQAQEAVNRVKAPDGEHQPHAPVELFVSTERLMILNANLQEILIDHELRMVSYIADIGDIFVLMARRPSVNQSDSCSVPPDGTVPETETNTSRSDSGGSSTLSDASTEPSDHRIRGLSKTLFEQTRKPDTKLICHVLESSDARLIAQSVGHAFQLAYLDFLRESGVEDLTSVKHLNYQDVLNQQEIFCDELTMFTDKQRHKQITIPKQRGEPLGVVIVASGWGSLLPTALLANMNPLGPAARCGQLNIGNHIISVNDHSLVGLPLNSCQQIIKTCRSQTSVRLTVVDCPPVVEVLIRRPNLQYQLGFSVQDGVICSLLRGGIAERGGIRVDHRIIEINGESVVAVPHEKIVHLLATSVGEIHLRTMPTSVFRLLTGQDVPNYI
ncbi:protein lin-10 [Clonorchis sinensis]|uniref:Protein lin-10 n=1 Tax=Clonorchis sinensis TaxID=79923 RepID=G7YIL3_CLOSI|nr:protein lin-10 [Clonorchis sinensis]